MFYLILSHFFALFWLFLDSRSYPFFPVSLGSHEKRERERKRKTVKIEKIRKKKEKRMYEGKVKPHATIRSESIFSEAIVPRLLRVNIDFFLVI